MSRFGKRKLVSIYSLETLGPNVSCELIFCDDTDVM